MRQPKNSWEIYYECQRKPTDNDVKDPSRFRKVVDYWLRLSQWCENCAHYDPLCTVSPRRVVGQLQDKTWIGISDDGIPVCDLRTDFETKWASADLDHLDPKRTREAAALHGILHPMWYEKAEVRGF